MLGLCFTKEEPIFNLKNNWEKKRSLDVYQGVL